MIGVRESLLPFIHTFRVIDFLQNTCWNHGVICDRKTGCNEKSIVRFKRNAPWYSLVLSLAYFVSKGCNCGDFCCVSIGTDIVLFLFSKYLFLVIVRCSWVLVSYWKVKCRKKEYRVCCYFVCFGYNEAKWQCLLNGFLF